MENLKFENLKLKKEDEGGIYIYPDLIADERLNWFEKVLLSFYKTQGESNFSGNEILNMLGKESRSTYQRAKRHLKELGLIECDGLTERVIYKNN